MRRLVVFVFLLIGLPLAAPAQDLRLPNAQGSLKFAVIGDAGQPGSGQTAIAKQMVAWRTRFPFELVIMTAHDERIGPENCLLPSPAVLVRRDARIGGSAA